MRLDLRTPFVNLLSFLNSFYLCLFALIAPEASSPTAGSSVCLS